tara:strand:- start:161 stop:430 length:270 start_codon:yes stop_codon:yes gene_type:complete
MTGYEDYNRQSFNDAAVRMHMQKNTPLNPAILPGGLTQAQYMDICLAMIRAADAIYLLNGYEESKGALAELAYAEKLGLEVYYQSLEGK